MNDHVGDFERNNMGRRREVSTAVDGSDLPERPVTARQRAEVLLAARRKELQEYNLARSVRRLGWQDRLERRSLAVEQAAQDDRYRYQYR